MYHIKIQDIISKLSWKFITTKVFNCEKISKGHCYICQQTKRHRVAYQIGLKHPINIWQPIVL